MTESWTMSHGTTRVLTVLLVSDAPCGALTGALHDVGLGVVRVWDAAAAHAVQREVSLGLIMVSALVAPVHSGSVVDDLRERTPGVPVISFGRGVSAPVAAKRFPEHHYQGPLDSVGVRALVDAALHWVGLKVDP
jgi:hypothetical protein